MMNKQELKEKLQVERMTPQRMLLFELFQKQKGHLHVEEIYNLAQKKDPKINLSTVYRTLKEFKKAGLVSELHLEEDHHHYESTAKEEHHHMVCGSCGKVIDFVSPLADKMERSIATKHGFKVAKIHVQVTGLCQGCC
jgi:Fur family transcriptional regulator, ferric uptake regulator